MANLLDIEKLKRILFEKKITQAEFARKLGITAASVSGYMVGKSFPSSETLEKMGKVLNIPVKDLLNNSDAQLADKELFFKVIDELMYLVHRGVYDSGINDELQAKVLVSINNTIKRLRPNIYENLGKYDPGLTFGGTIFPETYKEKNDPPPADKENK